MKSTIKILSVLFLAFFTLSSCSKDDDPTDNEVFFDEYKGTISYTSEEKTISPTEGVVRVGKLGDTYNFYFDSDIPDIKGIKMEDGDGTDLIFEDGALGFIRITASNLDIGYTKDGKSWTADCDRD